MPPVDRYTFEACIVVPASRELVFDGQPQTLAPRVFDLLLHLLEQRDRVVSKDELLEQVWQGAALSDSAIARTVARLRQALGDSGPRPRLIRTVHGVGYRFAAAVWVERGSPEARWRTEPRPHPGHERGHGRGHEHDHEHDHEREAAPQIGSFRLAFLPFENHTGERQFGWMDLGLMSMAARALSGDPRLQLVPIGSVLKTLEMQPRGATAAEHAGHLGRVTGADWIVGTRVSRAEPGFAFEYRLMDAEGQGRSGRLLGAEPTALCGDLVRQIEHALFEPCAPHASDALRRMPRQPYTPRHDG